MKKNCLIIGGAGYIGSVLLDEIFNKYKITVFDSFLFNSIKTYKKNYSDYKFIQGDINKDITIKYFRKVDLVIHLAGLANDPSSDYDPNYAVQTNHISTVKIAKLCKEAKVKKLIYASSCSVYGDYGKKLVDEKVDEKPLTVYALSKLSSEREILKLANNKFKVISLRFATLFGYSPRMRFDLSVNVMTKNILQKKNIVINGNGEQYRSFVHVKDVVKSIIFFATNKTKLEYSVFNIGSNSNNVKIISLTKIFKKIFPEIKVVKNLKNFDFRSYEVDFKRLNKIFPTKNFISLDDGIIEIFNKYKNTNKNLEHKKFYNLKSMQLK